MYTNKKYSCFNNETNLLQFHTSIQRSSVQLISLKIVRFITSKVAINTLN